MKFGNLIIFVIFSLSSTYSMAQKNDDYCVDLIEAKLSIENSPQIICQADIPYLMERPLLNIYKSSKRKGSPVFSTCNEYLSAGFAFYEGRGESSFIQTCGILKAIENSKKPLKSFLQTELFDPPVTFPVIIGAGCVTSSCIKRTISESNVGETLITPIQRTLSSGGTTISILFRSDVNGDGFEDAVVWLNHIADPGTYRYYEIALVTKTNIKDERLEYYSRYTNCGYYSGKYLCSYEQGWSPIDTHANKSLQPTANAGG